MKCHYEVLKISQDADNSEIKIAYRKLALKWHPDKNPDCPDEAKEQFQTVQNAYEVLSDPQERAWYDSHREQLLRGAGSSFNDESLDLVPFCTPSCYKGFGDDDKGFYAVYKEVFKKLAAEEVDYLDDPEDFANIPMFENSTAEYEKVHEFYAYWMSFSTSKSFVWLDKYDIREADNRRVLKLLEKENNKIRQKARKERNDEIRQLVTFVRKRDKRVIAHTKFLQEKGVENKRKAEQMRKDKLAQRHAEMEEAKKRQSDVYKLNDFHDQLDQIEKHLDGEFGNSDEETLTGPSDMEDNDNVDAEEKAGDASALNGQTSKDKFSSSQTLYCTACNKLFKTVKSFENHENSKKHKENVANMVLETELDFSDEEKSIISDQLDDILTGDSDLQDEISSDDEALLKAAALSKKKKKKNKKTLNAFGSNVSHVENDGSLEDLNNMPRSRKARRAKNIEKASKAKAEKVETNPEVAEVVPGDDEVEKIVLEEPIPLEKEPMIEKDSGPDEDVIPPQKDNKDSKSEKKTGKAKVKKFSQKQKDQITSEFDETSIDTSHCCAICKVEFLSKNKLFDHLKKTGHSIFLPSSQTAIKVKEKEPKKKGSKNR